jgi:hypothetical protein
MDSGLTDYNGTCSPINLDETFALVFSTIIIPFPPNPRPVDSSD